MLHRAASPAVLAAPHSQSSRAPGFRPAEFSGRRGNGGAERRRRAGGGLVCGAAAPPIALSLVRADRALQRLLGSPGADGVSDLPDDILRQHVNIVHQRRGATVEHLVSLSAASTAGVEPFCHKAVVHVEERLMDDLAGLLVDISDPQLRQLLLEDVCGLVRMFSALTGQCCVAAKLELVTKTLCPRLHADSVPLRLLVTYAGAGTFYVADEDVDRNRLLVPPEASGNDEAVRPGKRLVEAGCGDVLLLKGNVWSGNKGHGAVHRSPHGTSESCPRLVLTIDNE